MQLGILAALIAALFLAGPDLKNVIKQQQERVQSDPKGGSEHKKNLAILYYKDQEAEKAFETFLEALTDSRPQALPIFSDEEKQLYNEALGLYLDRKGQHAAAIREKFQPILKAHTDYVRLGFIVAASYANLELFPDFFDLFYQSYKMLPDHYLAFKGKAALHAQLFARGRTQEQKEKQTNLIIQNLVEAIERYPADTSLYQMLFTFAPQNKKSALVNTYLNKIIAENIIIARADAAFYVQQAVSTKQKDLAQQFLNKCLEWYPNSRTLQHLPVE